jgi:hypothetical protein
LSLLIDFQQMTNSEGDIAMTKSILTPAQRAAAHQGRHERRNRRVAQAAASVDALLADAGGPLPAYAQAHAAKAREGKMRSLIALKCLDCCCWEKSEVAACPVTSCPLYALRPYGR